MAFGRPKRWHQSDVCSRGGEGEGAQGTLPVNSIVIPSIIVQSLIGKPSGEIFKLTFFISSSVAEYTENYCNGNFC